MVGRCIAFGLKCTRFKRASNRLSHCFQFKLTCEKNLSPLDEAFSAVNNPFHNYSVRDKPAQHEKAMQKTTLLSMIIVVWDLAVGVIGHAQQPKKAPRIGYLASADPNSNSARCRGDCNRSARSRLRGRTEHRHRIPIFRRQGSIDSLSLRLSLCVSSLTLFWYWAATVAGF
jgi:hypothetical protein